jgi:DNA-binding transcriptional MerR regulator
MVRMEVFSIGQVARLAGVSIKQIRFWEEKGYLEKAKRLICGERRYRQYDMRDVERIRWIKDFMEEGYTLKEAAKKSALKMSGGVYDDKEQNE